MQAVSNSCIEGDFEIIDESSDVNTVKGFVQYCEDGVWKRVCQRRVMLDGKWTTREVTVACRQLGYKGIVPIFFSTLITYMTITRLLLSVI